MSLNIPFEPEFLGVQINMHLVLEYVAFFVGFRYYLWLRKKQVDTISSNNRLSIIIGAVFGALILSRAVAFLEHPLYHYQQGWIPALNNKTIMGGLFGGLLGVELAKKYIGEKQSSGDLFTLPIVLGILIGRIGCFLVGVNEFTYGSATSFFLGMDLGDGIPRHPIALYEVLFLIFLFLLIRNRRQLGPCWPNGYVFKFFMVSYFSFRFCIEFIKPNEFLILGLSTIQYLCVICWLYYAKFILQGIAHARKKLHIL